MRLWCCLDWWRVVTVVEMGWQSYLLTASYYAWLSYRMQAIRLSYGALVLANIGVLQVLDLLGVLNVFWGTLVIGGSGLYVIGLEPALSGEAQRQNRHWLRCLMIAAICLVAVVELESATGSTWLGLGVGLLVAIAGLALRVRAYLYVGTLCLVVSVLRQAGLAIASSSIALWSVGILLGLALIWGAATFEARREKTLRTLHSWSAMLAGWE